VEIRGATLEDAEQVVGLIGAEGADALAHLRAAWTRPHFRLGLDNLVAEDDGLLTGYAAVSPAAELVLETHDDAVADELYERIRKRGRERGDRTLAVTVAIDANAVAGLVRRHSFVLDHETLTMWRPLDKVAPDPVVPEGIALRTFDPADARAVHELLDEAYLAWDQAYVPVSHEGWESSMTGDIEFDPTAWFLAERDGALVGCSLHWSSGWLKDIAVRSSERGRGLGAALLQTGLAEFSRRGCARVGLRVDAANPTGAVRLYERLGFVTVNRQAVWIATL
jgi:ribosomal protein S18 acetylase RimI-like enzyme